MKILTALNNNIIYNKLKKELQNFSKYKIENKDILYKEGIIEFLKINSSIDTLILNTNLEGNIDVYLLIKTILELNKYIEIIAILEEDNVDFRKFLSSYNINKVLIEGKFNFDDILKYITNDESIKQKTIEKELEQLRELIFYQEQNTLTNKIKKKITNFVTNRNQKNKEKIDKRNNNRNNNKNKNKKRNTNKEIRQKSMLQTRKENKRKNKQNEIVEKDERIYFTLSESIQKYNVLSIDIIVKIKK